MSEKLPSLVSDSKILCFFLDDKETVVTRLLRITLCFFLIPLILIMVNAVTGELIIKGKGVGMFEDYLFLTFSIIVTPLLLVFLQLSISRFSFFLGEIPSFSKVNETEYKVLIDETCNLVIIASKNKYIKIAKILVGIIALYLNARQVSLRFGGWNSLSNITQFSLTFLHLIVMLLFILPEILAKYLVLLFVVIKKTRDMALEELIIIRPLAPDRSGGLKSLGDLSLAFTYFLIPFTFILLAHYITWREFTLGMVLGLASFIPVAKVSALPWVVCRVLKST